jgi:hypothetical protein
VEAVPLQSLYLQPFSRPPMATSYGRYRLRRKLGPEAAPLLTWGRGVRHGHARVGRHSPEYAALQHAVGCCHRPTDPGYKNYGARGITVCDSWFDGKNIKFDNFPADMGPKPSLKHELDRWPNKDGNYEPGNCRWATRVEQQNNKRSTGWGVTATLTQWSKVLNVNHNTLRWRLKRGLPLEQCF